MIDVLAAITSILIIACLIISSIILPFALIDIMSISKSLNEINKNLRELQKHD